MKKMRQKIKERKIRQKCATEKSETKKGKKKWKETLRIIFEMVLALNLLFFSQSILTEIAKKLREILNKKATTFKYILIKNTLSHK